MGEVKDLNYKTELNTALELARKAGTAVLEVYEGPLHVEQKQSFDQREPVTQADLIANEIIVQGIARVFPDDGILAEESIDTARRLDRARVWMIDPLDGTTGFIDGNGDFAVQIGLVEEGKPVVGVVYQPLTGVLYHAVRGGGAWIARPDHDPERTTVSNNTDLAGMRLAASRSHRSSRMDQVVKALGVEKEVQRGSVGIKIGLIVERQSDLYVHLSPRTKQWDTCAPEVILHEAGGSITDLFGQPLRYNTVEVQNRNGIVASNGTIHQRVIETLAPLLMQFERFPI